MKVIQGGFTKQACSDLIDRLDEIKEGVLKGEITDFVCAFIQNEEYITHRATSIAQGLVLTTALRMNIERTFRGE